MVLPPVVAIVGPTASGKSELALDVAERLRAEGRGAEVVNTDAMQVYRGMDIGTAKLAPAQRRGVPHHLLDLFPVTATATVAQFQEWARAVVADVRAAGTVPLLVGGSALYTRAVLDRFEFPGTDEVVRARWEQRLAAVGPAALHAELAARDPAAAAGIRAENGRRVVRALEVGELTGRSFTATLPRLEYRDPSSVQVGVRIDRALVDARIEDRVRTMYAHGLLDEVERLVAHGLSRGRTASRAIGYREAAAHLAGDLTRDQAVEQTVVATRRFARRQLAWWRKDPRIVWVEHDDPERVDRVLAAAATVSRSQETSTRTVPPP